MSIKQNLEDTFAEAAFAESNVESGMRAQVQAKGKAETRSVTEKLSDLGAAAAFAGANDHETAKSIVQNENRPETVGGDAPLILVIGGADSFSRELIDYAVEMAGRMKAQVMALNINSKKDDAYAAELAAACRAQGTPFSHLVRAGHKDQIVEALSRKHPNLQYVMSEPPKPTVRSIPVYRPAPRTDARPRARAHV